MSARKPKTNPAAKPGQSPEPSPESRQFFSTAFHSSPTAIVLSRLTDGRFLEANESFLKLTGYELNEVLGLTSTEAGITADPKAREERLAALQRDGQIPPFEVDVIQKSGEARSGLATVAIINIEGERFALSTFIDITDRKNAERQVLQMKRLYATLSQVNQTIVRVQNQDELFQSICDVSVQFGEFALAWIGLFDEASGDIKPVKANGLDVMQWPFETINIHQGKLKDALSATAIRTARVVTSEDVQTDERTQNVREQIQEAGYHSSAAVPFRLKGKTIGVLGLASCEIGLFKDIEEIRLLEEMSLDISFALDAMAAEAERKRAEERIHDQLERMDSLREIDAVISASFDMKLSLEVIVSRAVKELNVDAADVLVLDTGSTMLEYRAGWGFHTKAFQYHELRVGEGIAGRCAFERKPVHIRDLRKYADVLIRKTLLTEEKFIGYYCIPLINRGEVKGLMEIFHRSELDPEQEWINFLKILAGQAAIAIDSAILFSGLQRSNLELGMAYDQTIEGWSRALDLRDKEAEGHTRQVTELTLQLAQAFGLNDTELVHIRRGALLHDIGKLGVADEILFKPGPLTDEEWLKMRRHPQFAYDLISPIGYLRPALHIPYCHHERWDGTGYPRGLKGEQIPLSARMFAVVDMWDSLQRNRPYRPSWRREKVLEHIRSLAGTQFDPQVVDLFFRIINEKR